MNNPAARLCLTDDGRFVAAKIEDDWSVACDNAEAAERLISERDRLRTAFQSLRFVPVTERLPEIDVSAPSYSQHVPCVVITGSAIYCARYARNASARTEKGREPRWERIDGSRLWDFSPIVAWLPLSALSILPGAGGGHE